MFDLLLSLNLIFSLVGGSIVGGLTGAQLFAIVTDAFNQKPKNPLPLTLAVFVWTIIGALAAYNSVPVCAR